MQQPTKWGNGQNRAGVNDPSGIEVLCEEFDLAGTDSPSSLVRAVLCGGENYPVVAHLESKTNGYFVLKLNRVMDAANHDTRS